MDAGMTLFRAVSGFGDTLGQVAAELEVYGNVLKPCDMADAKLPESTGDCDLFLDWSTPWRIRYISCIVESAGKDRYAATFKEGNRSTVLRGAAMFCLLVSFAATALLGHGICAIAGIIFAGLTAYLWILPSRKAQNTVRKLMDNLGKI